MFFRPALFLAMVALAIARPNPSSLKTIASATGSKSSIKSPSQKLAEKNSIPSVASIIEIPLQSASLNTQTVAQTENLGINLQSQDSDSTLQYSKNLLVKENFKPGPVSSAVQNAVLNENVKPSSYSNLPENLSSLSSSVPEVVKTIEHQPAAVENVPLVHPAVVPVVENSQAVPVQNVPVVLEVSRQAEPVVKEALVAPQPTKVEVLESKPVVNEVLSNVVVQSSPVASAVVPIVTPVVESAKPVVEPEHTPIVAAVEPVVSSVAESAKPEHTAIITPVVEQPLPVVPSVVESVKSVIYENVQANVVKPTEVVPNLSVVQSGNVAQSVSTHSS